MTYIVDTHPFVWFLENDPRLSSAARNCLQDPAAKLVLPTMVLVEIAFLSARRRITADLPIVYAHLASAPNCKVHPLDEVVVQHVPTTLNIHDAIIVATAIVHRDVMGETTAILTKDAQIAASGLVQVIW
jgi:PIN domain nuclease of toxin-antitoxin system